MHFFPQLTFTNRLWKPFPCQSYLLRKLSGISYYVYSLLAIFHYYTGTDKAATNSLCIDHIIRRRNS